MKKILSGFVLLSFAFTSCSKINQGAANLVSQLNTNDRAFLQSATLTNLAQIAAAKLADSVALRSEVKAFAKTVIANRTSEQKSLDSVAGKWGITLPVVPEAQQLQAISVLRQVGPALFDAAYVAAQATEQNAAELLYQGEIKSGANVPLVLLAKRVLPLVENDLAQLEALLPH